jgi:hypothetical protein
MVFAIDYGFAYIEPSENKALATVICLLFTLILANRSCD